MMVRMSVEGTTCTPLPVSDACRGATCSWHWAWMPSFGERASKYNSKKREKVRHCSKGKWELALSMSTSWKETQSGSLDCTGCLAVSRNPSQAYPGQQYKYQIHPHCPSVSTLHYNKVSIHKPTVHANFTSSNCVRTVSAKTSGKIHSVVDWTPGGRGSATLCHLHKFGCKTKDLAAEWGK